MTVSTSSNDLDLALSKVAGIPLRLRSERDVDSIAVSIAPANGLPAGQLALAKDTSGSFKLPPALRGRTFYINTYEYAPLTVSQWDGAPLELQLPSVKRK